jgi:hypothetical protein
LDCQAEPALSAETVGSQFVETILDEKFLTLDLCYFRIVNTRVCEHFLQLDIELLVLLFKLPDVRIKGHCLPPLHFHDSELEHDLSRLSNPFQITID